jgi:hypothetical protein
MTDYETHKLVQKAERCAEERRLKVYWVNTGWTISKPMASGHPKPLGQGQTASEILSWIAGYDVGRKIAEPTSEPASRPSQPVPDPSGPPCPCDTCDAWKCAWENAEACKEYSMELGSGLCDESFDRWMAAQTPCKDCGGAATLAYGLMRHVCPQSGIRYRKEPAEWIERNRKP